MYFMEIVSHSQPTDPAKAKVWRGSSSEEIFGTFGSDTAACNQNYQAYIEEP